MPITGNDYVSEGAKSTPFAKDNQFQITELSNTLVQKKQANLGQDVSLDSLASDQASFTGQPQGFASKFQEGKLGEGTNPDRP